MALDHVIERSDFDELLDALTRGGDTIVGPTVRDRAIVYDEIRGAADLPVGWADEQDGGHYRLRRRDDEALFEAGAGLSDELEATVPMLVGRVLREARSLLASDVSVTGFSAR